MHSKVPGLHSPSEVPQVAPPPGFPLSITPSQSLSRPSQTSTEGFFSPSHTDMPLGSHTNLPCSHAPTFEPHCVPIMKPSSMTVSQSSSLPLQISSTGIWPPTQVTTPSTHCDVPWRHSPLP